MYDMVTAVDSTGLSNWNLLRVEWRNVPGGPVVKNPPANAGDTGSIPGPGKIPHSVGSQAHAHSYDSVF